MAPSIRVVLASANPELLTEVKARLAGARSIRLVGEARGARQLLTLLSERRPALIILDPAISPAARLSLLARVKRCNVKTRVLTIVRHCDEREMLEVAKAGGTGTLAVEAIPAFLAKAVRCMAAGESWFTRKLTGKIVEELHRLTRPHLGVERRRRMQRRFLEIPATRIIATRSK